MRRIRLAAALIAALLAVGAWLTTGTGASGLKHLKLKTAAGELAPGAQVVATSTNLIFETSAGNLECSNNVLTGKLTVNSAKKDTGSIEKEESTGGEPGGLCKTTTPFGATEISTANLPWPTLLTTKGVDEVKAKKVSFTSTFPNAAGAKCTFETAKVKSTFTIGGPVVIHTVKQKFKANKSVSNPQCPKEGTLTGDFTGTSNGETVESELD